MKNRHPEYLTTPRERGSYWTYFVGQNLIYYLVTGYLVTYTMMIGVDATKTAAIMFAVKFWDAINDALFGLIFDKVRFKNGKCLPWIRISTAALPLAPSGHGPAVFYPPVGRGDDQADLVRHRLCPVGFGLHHL